MALCPTTIFTAVGVITGVSAAGAAGVGTTKIVRRVKRKAIGAIRPQTTQHCQVIELMVQAALAAFGRTPFRPRDLWTLMKAELESLGIDHKGFDTHLWNEATKYGRRFIRTGEWGYYVVAAEPVKVERVKPNTIILQAKQIAPLAAAWVFALSGWWLKPIHVHAILHQMHGLIG